MTFEITTVPSKTFSGTTDVLVNGTRVGFFESKHGGMFGGVAFVNRNQRSVGSAKTQDEIIARIVEANRQ